MAKRYGTPYRGSKNQIAGKIIDFLPPGEVLVDICAGGCAITHAALEQMEGFDRKWNRVIANDIDPMPLELFRKAVNGEMQGEKRWISREDFFRLRDKDPYVRYCWSFGTGGNDYLYSVEIEPWKKACHFARVYGDFSLLEEIIGEVPSEAHENLPQYIRQNHDNIKAKYIDWYVAEWVKAHNTVYGIPLDADMVESEVASLRVDLREYLRDALKKSGLRAVDVDRHLGTNGMAGHYFGSCQWEFPTPEAYRQLQEILPLERGYPWHLYLLQRLQRLQSLQSLERLQSLESLQRLQSLQSLQSLESLQSLQRLQISNLDYADVAIPEGAVIYADIPYKGTCCGTYEGFDHARFYDWAAKQENIYISSYEIDDPRFVCVWETGKYSLLNGKGSGEKKQERIYTTCVNAERREYGQRSL